MNSFMGTTSQQRAAIAIIIGTVLLIGCSSTSSETKEQLKITYISKLKNESFHDGIASGVRKEMAEQGIRVDIIYAKNQQDVETQERALIAIAEKKHYDGVMLAPNDSEALVPYVAAIDRAGIPFILIDTPLAESPLTKSFQHDCGFVGTNNVLAGELAAKYIIGQIPKGTIFMMRGNHKHQSSVDREKGFIDGIQSHGQFDLIGRIQGWWETEAAYGAFSSFMKQNRRTIDAVFAYSDPMALGVSQYFDEHPHLKRPIIVGVDGTLVGQRGVLTHKLDATVVQAPEVMGRIGLRNLIQCIQHVQRSNILTPVTLLQATLALEKVEEYDWRGIPDEQN